METLLLWHALNTLYRRTGEPSLHARMRSMESVFERHFTDAESGLLLSATGECRQRDIWASCYAVHIGFPLQAPERIADWLLSHLDKITESGQLRHLPEDEYWQKTFVPVQPDTYQNGAFWATPVEWLCSAISLRSATAANRLLHEVSEYFDTNGIFECICGDYRKLDTYTASAANVYAAAKRFAPELL